MLSILAIGAIYANERETGDRLHYYCRLLLRTADDDFQDESFEELVFEAQGRILAIQYGLFSGDDRLVRLAVVSWPVFEAISRKGLMTFVEAGTWKAWIQLETFKRYPCPRPVLIQIAVLDAPSNVRIPHVFGQIHFDCQSERIPMRFAMLRQIMGSHRIGMANSLSFRTRLVPFCTRHVIERHANPRKSEHIHRPHSSRRHPRAYCGV